MNIKVGGTYLNGFGEEIKITKFVRWNVNYPYHCGVKDEAYTSDGGCLHVYAERGSDYNLVKDITPHLQGKGKTVRLFTPIEHARLKGIPEHLVKGISPTTAHEGLGQSILYNHAYTIAKSLGISLAKL